MCRRALLAACALLVHAAADSLPAPRCTHAAAGDLVGHEIFLNRSALVPSASRQFRAPVPALPGCELNGVSARVCDMFAPEVTVATALHEVRVRRLGPRMFPVVMHMSLYCDPQHALRAARATSAED